MRVDASSQIEDSFLGRINHGPKVDNSHRYIPTETLLCCR
jgi:hypothetical protein